MAAGVTYNGVPSAEGGNIFRDMSFWVAQRIPMRDTVLGLIKNNGGVVVPLEKDADVLIADHARKDAPAGACSWKYVTESVQGGIMQLKDRYQIGPAPGAARPVGSSRPTKRTRTPYTHADDVELVQWVFSHSKSSAGNIVYQELEARNPRHTWQSWRERYNKVLVNRGQPYLEKLAREELPAEVEVAVDQASNAPEIAANQVIGSISRTRQAATSASPSKPAAKTVAGKARSPARQGDVGHAHVRPSSRVSEAERNLVAEQPDHSPRVPETQDDDDAMNQFFNDLNDFVEATDAKIELEHLIEGKIINLWDISQAVGAQKVPVDEVDWIKVAEDLGYDWEQRGRALDTLKVCYDNNLAEFVETMNSFGQDQEEDAGRGTDEGLQQASPRILSSPPVNGKRRAGDVSLASPGQAKRIRLSRDAEIPSTPDEKIGYSTRSPMTPSISPGVQRNILRLRQVYGTNTPQQPLNPDQSSRQEIETETIVFGTQIQSPARLERAESTFDVTPSQQLQSEELDSRPIPLDLERGRPNADTRRETYVASPQGTGNVSTPMATQARARTSRRSLPSTFRSSANRIHTGHAETEPEPQPEGQRQMLGRREKSNQQQIQEAVERFESLGYPHHIVIEALKRTTMVPGGLAGLVMQSLLDGKGVPTHHEGIWTDRDDKSLHLVDSTHADTSPRQRMKAKKESDRLIKKHGLNRIELRRLFLAAEARDGD